MSLRAVGEGHVSTIEFRTGRFGPGDSVTIDRPASRLGTGTATAAPMTLDALRMSLGEQGDAPAAEGLLRLLPAQFTPADLDQALDRNLRDGFGRSGSAGLIDRIRRLAASNYDLTFPAELDLSARVLHPSSPAEDRGLEDARFTRFVEDDGSVTHYATYTAFDGSSIAPHLIKTDDFRTFSMRQLTGTAATNKGMALFPRRVGGTFWALCRWDRENLSVDPVGRRPALAGAGRRPAASAHLGPRPARHLRVAHRDLGRLARHHPRRRAVRARMRWARCCSISTTPPRCWRSSREPLMAVRPSERDGYVPNVVYSCGALVRDDTILLPYGVADATVGFALIDLPGLLHRLRGNAVAQPQDDAMSQVVG